VRSRSAASSASAIAWCRLPARTPQPKAWLEALLVAPEVHDRILPGRLSHRARGLDGVVIRFTGTERSTLNACTAVTAVC
jgi:hypothetical protein